MPSDPPPPPPATSPRHPHRLLLALLTLSALLNSIGLWWGLPQQPEAWAPDELSPGDVFESAQQRFSGGWQRWYPPMHYYVLTLAQLPLFIAIGAGWTTLTDPTTYTGLYVIVRLVSVAMATATVWLLYLCARELDDERTALFAALMTALVLPLVYYAKVANVDGPAVFWYALGLWCYLRALSHHRLRHYLGLALAASAAVATKDQMFGLFAGMPVALAMAQDHARRAQGGAATWWSAVFDRRMLLAGTAALVSLAVLENVLFNWSGLAARWRWLPDLPKGWELVPNTPAGHLRLLRMGADHVRFSLGWPFFAAVVAGALGSLRHGRREPRRLALLVPLVFYWVLLIMPIRQVTDRYLLPVTVTSTLFGAPVLSGLWTSRRLRPAGAALVSASVLYSFAYASSIDWLMLSDSRYAAERWLAAHVPQGTRIAAIGHRTYHPRLSGYDAHYVPLPEPGAVAGLRAEYVIVTGAYREDRFPNRPLVREFFSRLEDGSLGYVPVWRDKRRPRWSLVRLRGIETNLDKVDAEIVIYYRRRPAPAPPG